MDNKLCFFQVISKAVRSSDMKTNMADCVTMV